MQVLEGTDEANALRLECQKMLDSLYQGTFWQLTERLSEFTPLLPDDDTDTGARTLSLAHWCEGSCTGSCQQDTKALEGEARRRAAVRHDS